MQQHLSWQETINRALSVHTDIPSSRFLQLATVDIHGQPHCRTLVFRGFDQDKNQLYLHTDKRSVKIAQLESNNRVETCWYFSETREQFRFKGQIECIGHLDAAMEQPTSRSKQQLRLAHWQNLSDALRESYGSNYSHAQPDENFTLLIVHITQVDYLRLAPLPHLRLLYSLDEQGKWQTKAGSP